MVNSCDHFIAAVNFAVGSLNICPCDLTVSSLIYQPSTFYGRRRRMSKKPKENDNNNNSNIGATGTISK
jgi:hypothetical protein